MSTPHHKGITVRHKGTCTSTAQTTRCPCKPSFRAEAYDRVTGRRVYKTFPTLSAAESWRRAQQVKIARGEVRAVKGQAVTDVWAAFKEAVESGVARNRSGHEYKPATLRSYEQVLDTHVLPRLGRAKVAEVRRAHIQRLIDEMVATGAAPQTVRNVVTALRVVFKWAARNELLVVNPCDGVALPSGGGRELPMLSPAHAVDLLGALQSKVDRALWATAFFAGLRRGELLALDWQDVDLVERTIRVRRAWDVVEKQYIPPKSKAGKRTLRFPQLLVPYLAQLDTTAGPVFPGPYGPLGVDGIYDRAERDFKGKEAVSLHDARHTYASMMIAAGVNAKTLQVWMGHSSITVTYDRYGHLLPGSEDEAIGQFDAYLERELAA